MTLWDMPPVFFDIETQSVADLPKVGGRVYAAHPSTRILTFVALIDGHYHIWSPVGDVLDSELWPTQLGPCPGASIYTAPEFPAPIAKAAQERLFIGHNAWGFDAHIWREKIAHPLPLIGDTLPLARAAGISGRLAAAAAALFGGDKDKGSVILRKYMNLPTVTPPLGALSVITRYNIADVALLARLWDEIDVELEADVLEAHREINERGVAVDLPLLNKILAVSNASIARAATTITELTGGVLHGGNLRSTKQVHEWLASHGLKVHDYTGKKTLRKDIVEQALANPWMMLDKGTPFSAVKAIPPEVFDVLKLRGAALRITGAKIDKAMMRLIDGRLYDLFSYWQAHTGRWSSVGVQVHNLPRAKKGVDVERLLAMHESGEWKNDDPDAYDKIAATLNKVKSGEVPPRATVDDAASSLLRPSLTAATGHTLLIADWNAIECRGLAWIAGEEWLLAAFAAGVDPYKIMAAKVWGITPEDVNSDQRQVGKVIVLGCGYGMSADKFGIYVGLQGVNLANAGVTADQCVEAYRAAHPKIAGTYAGEINGRAFRRGGIWDLLDRAAMNAVSTGAVTHAGKCTFRYDGKTLAVELPSGRRLRYRNARIEDRIPAYAIKMGIDKTKATLVYDGAHGEASLYGGKWAENVVQAICRDLLATALVRQRAERLGVVVHVHDEPVAEVPLPPIGNPQTDLERFCAVMVSPPAWAEGFPLAVEGKIARRYQKRGDPGWSAVSMSG